MKLDNLQELTFEFEEIESIENVGYMECYDIEVQDDKSFTLGNGIISHNSAFGGLSKAMGNDIFSYYLLKGKPLNCWEVSPQKFASNKELSELFQILNNNLEIQEKKDGKWFKIEIDGKEYIVNENDTITLNDKEIDVKELLKNL